MPCSFAHARLRIIAAPVCGNSGCLGYPANQERGHGGDSGAAEAMVRVSGTMAAALVIPTAAEAANHPHSD